MIELPGYINFVSAENAAAGMSRGLTERTDSWGRLIAQAQRVLGSVQNMLAQQRAEFSPEMLYGLESSAPLIAAARILDAASQAESLDPSHKSGLALCAAAAFSMYGNFPAAQAVIQNSQALSEALSSRIWLAIGCFTPRNLGNARIRAIESGDALSSAAVESLQSFLATGNDGHVPEVDRYIRESFARCTDNQLRKNICQWRAVSPGRKDKR